MKKYFLHIIIVLILSSPWPLEAKGLFIKMTFGVVTGGNVEDNLITSPEFSYFVTLGEKGRSQLGQAVCLELIYQLSPYVSFSVSNGYASKMLKGKPAIYTSPAYESIIIGGF